MNMIDLKPFELSNAQLQDVRNTFAKRTLDGLAKDGQELKCLPAYLPKPTGTPTGQACVIDVGGTNMRSALLEVGAGNAKVLGVEKTDGQLLTTAKVAGKVTSQQFFEKQCELAINSCGKNISKVGYCFSYPARIESDLSATLLSWTKGIQIDGVPDSNVAYQLRDELQKHGNKIERIVTMNDTVAALLAAVVLAPSQTHYIGLIAGTGTNMASFFQTSQLAKLPQSHFAEMAVNLESGNFHPPHLTAFDDQLDTIRKADSPGRQRFEKAIAGSYLPHLFTLIVGGEDEAKKIGLNPNAANAGEVLVNLRSRADQFGQLANTLVNRSADLVAATLAGLIQIFGSGRKNIAIMGEGSFVTKTAGYKERVSAKLAELIANENQVEIIVNRNEKVGANLIGAACAALM